MAAACLAAASIAMQPACKVPPRPSERVLAEADLYSGRANPVWVLSRSQTTRLRQMLLSLGAGMQPPSAPGLGYRGLVLRYADPVLPGCAELRVYRGTVAAQCGGGGTLSLADPGRAVERYLAGTGLQSVDAAAYGAVQQDLAAGG
jgi:hypothetical protein